MFSAVSWAQAFINILDNTLDNAPDSNRGKDARIDEGFETLKALASFVKSLPGPVSGKSASEKLENLIRRAMAENTSPASAPVFEATLRFIILLVRKDRFRYVASVIEKIKNLSDKRRGIITASLECAFLPGMDESKLIEVIKKRSGAKGVELTERLNPQLIGGYRLRIGDELIDASIRSQLRGLLTAMQSGGAAMAWNGGY